MPSLSVTTVRSSLQNLLLALTCCLLGLLIGSGLFLLHQRVSNTGPSATATPSPSPTTKAVIKPIVFTDSELSFSFVLPTNALVEEKDLTGYTVQNARTYRLLSEEATNQVAPLGQDISILHYSGSSTPVGWASQKRKLYTNLSNNLLVKSSTKETLAGHTVTHSILVDSDENQTEMFEWENAGLYSIVHCQTTDDASSKSCSDLASSLNTTASATTVSSVYTPLPTPNQSASSVLLNQ